MLVAVVSRATLDGGDTTAVVSSFATRANRPSKGGAFTGDATEDRVLLFSMMTTYKCKVCLEVN